MEKRTRWLRISYWTGMVIDAGAVLRLLMPNLFAAVNQLPNFRPSLAYTYASGMAASLMLGWTVLLLWANRQPLERKGVLVITVVPVILGLVTTKVWAAWSGFLEVAALSALFAFSYLQARSEERFSHRWPVAMRKER